MKYDSFQNTLITFHHIIQVEYARHSTLAESDKLTDVEKIHFAKILSDEYSEIDLATSLEFLTHMLYKQYGTAPIVFIDEYDTPLQEGKSLPFYDELVNFLGIFFSSAFKDNRYFSFAFLTGILRILDPRISSIINTCSANPFDNDIFDQYFGYTEEEVDNMLSYMAIVRRKWK